MNSMLKYLDSMEMNRSLNQFLMVLQYVLRKYLHCGPLNYCMLEHWTNAISQYGHLMLSKIAIEVYKPFCDMIHLDSLV